MWAGAARVGWWELVGDVWLVRLAPSCTVLWYLSCAPACAACSSSKLQTPAHFQVFLSFDKSAHGGGGIIQGPNGQTHATRDINRMRVLRILKPRPNE